MMRLIPLLLLSSLVMAGCGGTPTQSGLGDVGTAEDRQRQEVVNTARAMLGTPYRFGGASPGRGFDCSGLVHYAYARAGHRR